MHFRKSKATRGAFLTVAASRTEATFLERRAKIYSLLDSAEYFQRYSSHFRWNLASHLAHDFKLERPVRDVAEAYFHSEGQSLAELEAQYEPERVVSIAVSQSARALIESGEQTIIVLANNQYDIKTGKGFLTGEGFAIPILIENIEFEKPLHKITAEYVSKMGQVNATYTRHGLKMAQLYLAAELESQAPGFKARKGRVTVVTFRRAE